jgi:hypothetical protein
MINQRQGKEVELAMGKSLEERVRYLEDTKEIRELMHKYCYTMDAGDWDGVMSCYAKECSCNFGHFSQGDVTSRKKVEDFYRKVLMSMFAVFIHRITNEIIDIKDDTHATGRWYLDEPCILHETKRAAWSTCTYYVDFIKEDGKWLFSRVTVSDWRWVSDYEKGWAKEPFTVPGSHSPEDIAKDLKRWEAVQRQLKR